MKLYKLLPMLCLAPVIAHAGTYYEIKKFGIGPTLDQAYAHVSGLNNLGEAVGINSPDADHSYMPFKSSGGQKIALPYTVNGPLSINDHGVMAVIASAGNGNTYGPAIMKNGQVTYLGDLGHASGDSTGSASAINNHNQVVGELYTGTDNYSTHAALFSNGNVTDLGTLGGSSSSAKGINDSGTIIGSSFTAGSPVAVHAFSYSNGVMTDLGTLGGRFSSASGINAGGDIVGYAEDAQGISHAFLYRNGAMQDLGVPAGAAFTTASDINDAGKIIGSYALNNRRGAFLYVDGVMTPLDSLVGGSEWHVADAYQINELDQISAKVCRQSGSCELVLLSPVPEPTAWGMLLGGLGVLPLAARRHKGTA